MTPPTTQTPATKLALMQSRIENISADVSEIKANLSAQYVPNHEMALIRLSVTELGIKMNEQKKLLEHMVTVDQFFPVKVLVYGAAGLILTSVLGAVIALVITKEV